MIDTPRLTIGDDPALRDFVLRSALQVLDKAKQSGCPHPLIINVVRYPGTEDKPGGPYLMGICSQCTTSRTVRRFIFPQLTKPEE